MCIDVDDDTGLVHSVESTAASVAGITQADKLLHGDEKEICADAGYTGSEERPSMTCISPSGRLQHAAAATKLSVKSRRQGKARQGKGAS